LATALVIFGVVFAPASLPSRILAIPVIVWVGRVSYGLYLWHFPVVHVFCKDNVTLGLNDTGIQAVRLLVTFAIVTLSFYLVEQPILGGHWPPRFPGRRGRSDAPVVARGDASLRPAEVGTGEASTSST
jgi:peptidoglycan/LPS O-acetylase OafA/YrhL